MAIPLHPIDHLTMSTEGKEYTPAPGAYGYVEGEHCDDCMLHFPDGSVGCVFTVHWLPSLWMAPLQLLYAPPTSKTRSMCSRRIVVQFPLAPNLGTGDKKMKEKVDRMCSHRLTEPSSRYG